MSTTITFDFYGETQLSRTIDRTTAAVSDFTPVFNEVIDDFVEVEKEWFASEGDGSWPALSEAYSHWKAKHYPGMPMLRRTDDLYTDLTQRPLAVEVITPLSARWGTTRFYGVLHQKGGWVSGQPPMRKVIDIKEGTRERWLKMFQAYLVRATRSAEGTPAWAPPTGPEVV